MSADWLADWCELQAATSATTTLGALNDTALLRVFAQPAAPPADSAPVSSTVAYLPNK